MAIHRLKTWPEHFEAMLDGSKSFEIRKNDRQFRKGDLLTLEEWQPGPAKTSGVPVFDEPPFEYRSGTFAGRYTGRAVTVVVTSTLAEFAGIEPGFVIMGAQVLMAHERGLDVPAYLVTVCETLSRLGITVGMAVVEGVAKITKAASMAGATISPEEWRDLAEGIAKGREEL